MLICMALPHLQERLAPSAVTHRISTLHPYNTRQQTANFWTCMSGTWSLSVQQWQTCVAVFQIFLRHIRRCSSSCGSKNLLQVAKFLDAGMKKLQTVDPDEESNI